MRTRRSRLALVLLFLPLSSAAQKTSVEIAVAREELLLPEEARALGAVAKLRRARGPAAGDALLDALALGLPPRVARAALEALRERRFPQATDVLVRYAHHRDPTLRAGAVAALGAMPDRRASDAVKAALGDADRAVRAAAGEALAARHDRSAVTPLLSLLERGDDSAVAPLARLANADVAGRVAELSGRAPDSLVAQCLGQMLLRADLGPEKTYAEVVRILGTLPGDDVVVALTNFLGAVSEKFSRPSRREAQTVLDQRLGKP